MLLSHVWLFVTTWIMAHQAPLFMEFSRQEYWSALPFPTLADLPDPGIKPGSLALVGGFFITPLPFNPNYPIGAKYYPYFTNVQSDFREG